jgi:ubiquinone/menaquinone biosynthesis C-methylase UbiE
MPKLHMPDEALPVQRPEIERREPPRSAALSEYWADFTLDVVRRAGIHPGMRVLDLGSGDGDVAMLAASLVGPAGEVIGVDRAPDSVDRATARAAAAELANIEFVAAELGTYVPPGPFDAVVGRFVLMYQPDPAALLRRLTTSLAPSAVLAFVEIDLTSARAAPAVPFVDDLLERMRETCRRVGVAIDLGPRLWRSFRAIGIADTEIRVDARAEPAPADRATEVMAELVTDLLPMMERLGMVRPGELDLDSLTPRFRAALVERQATFIPPNAVGTIGRLGRP